MSLRGTTVCQKSTTRFKPGSNIVGFLNVSADVKISQADRHLDTDVFSLTDQLRPASEMGLSWAEGM